MKRNRTFIQRLGRLVSRYSVEILGIAAIILFAVSFFSRSYDSQLASRVGRIERALHARERVIESYIHKALKLPAEVCLDMDDLPEDMVLYKYNFDTLHSWINEFPIQNDATDAYPYAYRLGGPSEADVPFSPLAALGDSWQYVNLGSEWFIVSKWYSSSRQVKIVAGIRRNSGTF